MNIDEEVAAVLHTTASNVRVDEDAAWRTLRRRATSRRRRTLTGIAVTAVGLAAGLVAIAGTWGADDQRSMEIVTPAATNPGPSVTPSVTVPVTPSVTAPMTPASTAPPRPPSGDPRSDPTFAESDGIVHPPQIDPIGHGEPVWAVVLAGTTEYPPNVDPEDLPGLQDGIRAAELARYDPSATDCDVGAAEALGIQGRRVTTVSVYFASRRQAEQALFAIQEPGWKGGVVAEVRTYCMD